MKKTLVFSIALLATATINNAQDFAQANKSIDAEQYAKSKFDLVLKDTKKKDFEEYIYVAQAYMNADNPNYKAAIEVMLKAKLNHPENAKVLLALGDAYYGDKNQNDAYVAYRDAYKFDPTLIRAKMQSGVLLKGAKAYVEAEKALNEVVAANPK